jgi:hypothetical protein
MRYSELDTRQKAIVAIFDHLGGLWRDVEKAQARLDSAWAIIENAETLEVNCSAAHRYIREACEEQRAVYERNAQRLLLVLYMLDDVGDHDGGYTDYLARYYTKSGDAFEYDPYTAEEYHARVAEHKQLAAIEDPSPSTVDYMYWIESELLY